MYTLRANKTDDCAEEGPSCTNCHCVRQDRIHLRFLQTERGIYYGVAKTRKINGCIRGKIRKKLLIISKRVVKSGLNTGAYAQGYNLRIVCIGMRTIA